MQQKTLWACVFFFGANMSLLAAPPAGPTVAFQVEITSEQPADRTEAGDITLRDRGGNIDVTREFDFKGHTVVNLQLRQPADSLSGLALKLERAWGPHNLILPMHSWTASIRAFAVDADGTRRLVLQRREHFGDGDANAKSFPLVFQEGQRTSAERSRQDVPVGAVKVDSDDSKPTVISKRNPKP